MRRKRIKIRSIILFLAALLLLTTPTLYFHFNLVESNPENKSPVLLFETPAYTEQEEEIVEINTENGRNELSELWKRKRPELDS